MKFLIDSSAWIEYFEGSSKGSQVNNFLVENNEIVTLPINIAEVVSYIERKKGNSESAYNVIVKRSNILSLTPKIAKESGILHSKMKKDNVGFSLADSFMIITAKSIAANLITCDNHFKSFKEAILIN